MTTATPTRDAQPLEVEVSAYLTDGWRLFRVVSGFTLPLDRTHAELEDCLTLQRVRYTPEELHAMRLRIVTPHAP